MQEKDLFYYHARRTQKGEVISSRSDFTIDSDEGRSERRKS